MAHLNFRLRLSRSPPPFYRLWSARNTRQATTRGRDFLRYRLRGAGNSGAASGTVPAHWRGWPLPAPLVFYFNLNLRRVNRIHLIGDLQLNARIVVKQLRERGL